EQLENKVVAGDSDLSDPYSHTLGELAEDTTYYFKAYAVNSAGTGYGEVASFTTSKTAPVVVEPTVETKEASAISTDSAILNGGVISDGNGEISEYGFYWGTSEEQLVNQAEAGDSDLSGAYSHTLGDLAEETTYYFRAYAVNSAGTGFGEIESFTTESSGGTIPELEVTVVLSRTEDVNFARPLGIEGVANESVDWQIVIKDSAGVTRTVLSPASGTTFSDEYKPEQTGLPFAAAYTIVVTATPAEGEPFVVTKTFGVSNYFFKTTELTVTASAGSLNVSAEVVNLEDQAKRVQGIFQITNSAGDVVALRIGEPVTVGSPGSEVLQFSSNDIVTPGTYQIQLFLWLQTEGGWIILGDSVVRSFTI
ncbi:fibronectin type III domain-containing protein, partial [Candidatus Micrarchaeota archaeon]|nr:fibronectin type III domain-containing protein [Candidatus Micrarchaeota archaeon]